MNDTVGRSRLSLRSSRRNCSVANNITRKNLRTLRGSKSTPSNQGNGKLSNQQPPSGNQRMLQGQKPRIKNKLQKLQCKQQEQQIEQNQKEDSKQQDEQFGDYTMERGKCLRHEIQYRYCLP